MPDRTLVYRVEVDGRTAGPGAAKIRADIERELGKVRFTPQVQAPRGGLNPSPSPTNPLALRGGRGGNELIPGFDDISKLTSFTVGGYAVTQMVQATLEGGKLGAENVRLARSFEQLAQGAGLTGDTLRNKLSTAVQQTVTEQKLMTSTNMLLAASQDGQIKVTEDQIATLAKFARLRSTQLTNNGRPMSTEEAYSRLIQGTVKRETELLDELGLSTKALAAQLGVPIQQVNSDVESLLAAITKVAEIEIDRFGEPIVDEATRIEQAATRIEESKNRINAALAGPTAFAYETAATIVTDFTGSESDYQNPYKDAILGDRQRAVDQFKGMGESALSGGEELKRLSELLRESKVAMDSNKAGADALDSSVLQLAKDILYTGHMTDEQRAKLNDLEVQLRLTNNGGIVLAQTQEEIGRTAAFAAGHVFDLAAGLFQVGKNGQLVKVPALGPMTRPDVMPNINAVEGMFGGGILGSAMQGPDAIQQGIGSAWRQEQTAKDQREEQETQAAIRESERAARETQSAFESAAKHTEDAFSDAAGELADQLRSIPGLFGRSEVTKDQEEMAKLGVGQNFADNYLRRLSDEVLNGKDWEGVSLADAATRAGIDQTLDPKAQLAIFSQKWADQSLFANKDNLDLFDQGAIRAEMERQRMSKMGQENIMGMFGLGEDGEGNTVFKDLGSIMANGMKGGAEEGLAEFGRDAIANTMMQLKGDAALAEYRSTGRDIFDAIVEGFGDGAAGSDLVGIVTTRVMAQIYDAVPLP